jgi:uncharacterized membrane protein YjjP (DUF1212 family)
MNQNTIATCEGLWGANMTREERSNLVLAAARVLYVNGQSTDTTLSATRRLSNALGFRAQIIPRWGELELQAEAESKESDTSLVRVVEANPTGVDMDRVASTMCAIDDLCSGRLTPITAIDKISAISKAPPAPAWLFTLAAGAGALALAVLFGVQHFPAAALIFISAAAGGILRRILAQHSANIFLQPFCAALLAGLIGVLAVHYELSSTLRLVAVCPCMVLVPGPHFLNGALDLMKGRINLGASRLIYAGVVVMAISTGLLIGLALLGVSLPVDPIGRALPLWQDVIAAGVAVACYSVFFSTPLHMLVWPVAVGMLAHALRWITLTVLGSGAATGAFVACLIVGLILTPVSRHWRMPFAAIGFASVVSMMPGVFLFRMASGLVQLAGSSPKTLDLISATFAAGSTAILIILAMSFGLIVPKMVIDRLSDKSSEAGVAVALR